MKLGQMFNNNLSSKADYYQLSICGKTAEDFRDFKFETIKGKKLILHGDWEKKGFTPNSIFIKERQKEISEICSLFSEYILGLTVHPPTKKYSINDFLKEVYNLKTLCDTNVFIENRSSKNFIINDINTINKIPDDFTMTIDIPQLFINGNYNIDIFRDNISKLSLKNNIKEVHIGGVQKGRVAQKLHTSILPLDEYYNFIKDKYVTLEILGGEKIFNESIDFLSQKRN